VSIQSRVVQVINAWCRGVTMNLTEPLEEIWARTGHAGVPFQKEAVESLVVVLQDEFHKPETRTIILVADDFKPNGNLNTVDDLVQAVNESRP